MGCYSRTIARACYLWPVLLLTWLAAPATAAHFVEADVCVYGGTSGGAVAAIQAARMGKRAVLLVFNNHVGGMTSGGLSQTDTGNIGSIGGIAREFHRRVGQRYGGGERFLFEPHIAEEVLNAMLAEAGVSVYTNQRLASVTKDGQRITRLAMEDGSLYYARMFIDTTYEGDLMAMAGVSFTVGRESIVTYGESLAGVRLNGVSTIFVDPYVTEGNPASGLLPLVQPGDGGITGSADHRLQAYNFRLCLTTNGTNRIAVAPPADYSEARYELLARLIEERIAAGENVTLSTLLYFSPRFNDKSDLNANGMVSTDFVGGNYTYATNTYATREQNWREHENYQRGLLYFLATSARVPGTVRAEMQTWGLCRDEFVDTGGWPHQLYVREARRMISDYVMNQQNCDGRRAAPDGIALGSYAMDSHAVQRVAPDGYAQNEGGFFVAVPMPYPISYRSIVPRIGEVENLFCTFALSASHVAFGSCRMEPVFMMTSQSAATAASLALDEQIPVQQLSYEKLRLQLQSDRQIVLWGSLNTTGVVDNADVGVVLTGSWTPSVSQSGYIGADYLHDSATGKGTKSVRFTPNLPTNGTYEVYARWTEHANRSPNVPVDIDHSTGTNRVMVNQQTQGGVWVLLGTHLFEAGTRGSVVVRNDGTPAGTFVVADAVWFKPVGFTWSVTPVVNVLATDPVAGEFRTNTGRFTVTRSGPTNTALTCVYSLSGTSGNSIDFAALSGSVLIPAGAISAVVIVSPLPDGIAEGQEPVILTLATNANYQVGPFSSAVINIADHPYDAWRLVHFTSLELADPAVSGPDADPDQDGILNVYESAMALNPKEPSSGEGMPRFQIVDGHITISVRQSKMAFDATVIIEASTDLLNWSAATLQQIDMIDEGDAWRMVYRDLSAVSARTQLFLRVRTR